AERLRQRRLRGLALFLHLLEGRSLVQAEPDPDRNDQQEEREQERNAPAPLGERRAAEDLLAGDDDDQREEQAERRRRLDPRGVRAALAVRRMLGDVGR